MANNTIPCTGELCSISTALQYSPPVSEIPHTHARARTLSLSLSLSHTHTHTHTHTELIILSKQSRVPCFWTLSTVFIQKKNCFRYWISSHPKAKGWRGTYCVVYETDSCFQWLDTLCQLLYCTYAHMHLGSY